MNLESLTYNGKNLKDFECYWDGAQVFRRAAREIEKFSIPGRSGDLTVYTNRFSNMIIPFNCFIKENFVENYRALLDFLQNQKGYNELRTTEEPNVYRRALYHAAVEPQTTPFNQAAQFTIEFDCDPRLFLDSGNEWQTLSEGKIIYNPTQSPSNPLLKVRGNGEIWFNFLDKKGEIYRNTYTVVKNNENLEMTIELGDYIDAYRISPRGSVTNLNGDIEPPLDDSHLQPGETQIHLVGDISAELQGRWFYL